MPADPVRSRIMRSRASSYCHRAIRKNVHGRVLLQPSVSRQSAPPCPPSAHRFTASLPVPSHTTPVLQHALALAPRKSRRYHEHLQLAGESLKEHLLLPVTVRVGILPPRTHAHPNRRPSLPAFYRTCLFCADDGTAGDAPERRAPPLAVTTARTA